MKKTYGEILKSSKMLRIIYSGFGVVFLGALGSGLWEVFLSDLLSWVSRVFLTLISRTFHTYVDSIHSGIGRGPSETFSIVPFAVIIVLACIFPWASLDYILRKLKKQKMLINGESAMPPEKKEPDEISTEISRFRKLTLMIGIPACAIVTLLYAELGFHFSYELGAALYVERSIDILAPKLASKQVLELRAQYRSVNDAKKFYQLEDKLKQLAQEFGVELPKFQSVRVER